uniref:Uncharacterized protein n=1 Tax=Desulfatirhabdium butyrativorans TaxID=340467 RepID=A0A7C4MM61_9BACT
MEQERLLNSDAFAGFIDETLRQQAIAFAEKLIDSEIRVKRHQLYSIPSAIQAGGLKEIQELVKKQAEKDNRNTEFWKAIQAHIAQNTPDGRTGLFHIVRIFLSENGFLPSEDAVQNPSEKKQLQRKNKEIVNQVIDQVLQVYFEHFGCHYFFRIQKGKTS